MKRIQIILVLLVVMWSLKAIGQDTLRHPDIIPVPGTDPKYVKTFVRPNDIRVNFGELGHGLKYQSTKEDDVDLNVEQYTNVSNVAGFGITYKFIDFDLTFTLPGSPPVSNNLENLKQFKLVASYTARKNSFRLYISDSKGIISTNPETDFESNPDIRLTKFAGQITHIFNHKRFSYRAANFQSELQTKSAGSFLLRLEPFYRELGMHGTALAPATYDIKKVFENQAGLRYVNAPGAVLMPGYAYTAVIKEGKMYVSPMILLGPGFAVNTYKSDAGKFSTLNWEWNGVLSLNTGYNGPIIYANLRLSSDLTYSYLNPSFFTTNEIKIYFTVGYRFRHLENKIPTSLI